MASAAIELLWRAHERAKQSKYVGRNFIKISQSAGSIDAQECIKFVRAATDELAKRHFEPTRDDDYPYATLAAIVAPLDEELKLRLLKLSANAGHRALDTARLWPVSRPARVGREDDPRSAVDENRLLLTLRTELWDAIATSTERPDDAQKRLLVLWEKAKSSGDTLSDAPASFLNIVLREFAQLDPALMISIGKSLGETKRLVSICAEEAEQQHRDGFPNPFPGILIRFAAENGKLDPRAVGVFAHYDLDASIKLARVNGTVEFMLAVLPGAIEQDLDRALELAENAPDPNSRRELVDQVSQAWAVKRPESIERALRNQDNEYRRDYARSLAAKEEFRRGEVGTGRTTPLSLDEAFRTGETMPKEERIQFLRTYAARASLATDPRVCEMLFRIDDAAGMEVLDQIIRISSAPDLKSATIYISRVSPQGLLKLYKANPSADKLYAPEQWAVLARADADYAFQEASKLPARDREAAIAFVAAGTASSDLDRALALYEKLSDDQKHRVGQELWINYLIAHPDGLTNVPPDKRGLAAVAAGRLYFATRNLDGPEKLISSLTNPAQKDYALGVLALTAAHYRNLADAQRLGNQVQNPDAWVSTACDLAMAIANSGKRESTE